MRIKRVIARLNLAPIRYYHRKERIAYPWQVKNKRHVIGREEFRRRLMEDLYGKIQ